jgi:hypothetical protein
MKSSSSLLSRNPLRKALQPAWSLDLQVRARGLALAREKGWVLLWDEKHWLYLVNRSGVRQAQVRLAEGPASACCADDGSAYAAVGPDREVRWLAPDLTVRWERTVPHRAVAAALDPFGQYLAVADARGTLYLFDRHSRSVGQVPSPRPLHHLAFVPAAPFLLGAADYGLVACFDLTGRTVWVDGLVAHVGSLAVSGDGDPIMLACFTEGLQRYNLGGKKQGRVAVAEPCRLAALSFDGRLILVAGLSNRLLLLDRHGRTLCDHLLDQPAVAVGLAALGENAVAALADGRLIGLGVQEVPPL